MAPKSSALARDGQARDCKAVMMKCLVGLHAMPPPLCLQETWLIDHASFLNENISIAVSSFVFLKRLEFDG